MYIKRKTCKEEGCNRYPSIGTKGYCWKHLPEDLKQKIGDKKMIQKRALNAAKRVSSKLRMDAYKEDSMLELWFKARRREMTGVCIECGKSTNRNNDRYYRWSICHIVPKGLVPSAKVHPDNWVELCQDHHNEFDSTFEKASKMKCFQEIKNKFKLFKDIIPPEEARKINPFL